jgi:hypothetical protein
LPGEAAFAEQVLIGVGHRGGVGIDAGVAGVARANSEPAALAIVTLTRGWRIP